MKTTLCILACTLLPGLVSQAQFRFGVGAPSAKSIDISYTNPKEYEIAEIKVQGLESLDEGALVSLTGLEVGDKIKIPGEEITEAINKVWNHGIVGDVSVFLTKVEGSKAWLTIELAERPRLTSYEITGVNKTQENEIKDKIDLIRGGW
ncbi:MAG: hypothetical protein HC842_02715 [Cytophagales bacterium]|nr:hypothetical protein [Cytophagales bacterium]